MCFKGLGEPNIKRSSVSISQCLILSITILTELPLASGRPEECLAAGMPSFLIIMLSDISSSIVMHFVSVKRYLSPILPLIHSSGARSRFTLSE